jgi:hypothetical protein
LLTITNKQHLGRCCVALDAENNERIFLVSVTDRSPEPLQIATLPLNLPALQNLLSTYTRLERELVKEANYAGANTPNSHSPDSTASRTNLATADSGATTIVNSGFDQALPEPAQPKDQSGGLN